MKGIIKKTAAAAMAALMMLSCAACGKDKTNEFVEAQGSQNAFVQQDTAPETQTGFSAADAAKAGFGMGSDTLDSIISRFGQPESSDVQDYTSVSIANASYPFGIFEFEGTPGSVPVLTYVQIFGNVMPPCGMDFSMNIEQAANAVLPGSGDGLMTEPEPQKYLYGSDAEGQAYGRYDMLTAEYVTSETNDAYTLEYRAPAAGGYVTLTVFFDADYMMTNYTLRFA